MRRRPGGPSGARRFAGSAPSAPSAGVGVMDEGSKETSGVVRAGGGLSLLSLNRAPSLPFVRLVFGLRPPLGFDVSDLRATHQMAKRPSRARAVRRHYNAQSNEIWIDMQSRLT